MASTRGRSKTLLRCPAKVMAKRQPKMVASPSVRAQCATLRCHSCMAYRASGQLLFTSEVYDGVVRVAASVVLRDSHTTTRHNGDGWAWAGREWVGSRAAGSLRQHLRSYSGARSTRSTRGMRRVVSTRIFELHLRTVQLCPKYIVQLVSVSRHQSTLCIECSDVQMCVM